MLKGDLAATPLPEVLRQLADGAATGCLYVVDSAGAQAQVYLRAGRVYAVVLPGDRPTLSARLVTSGALGPEALAEALQTQETELQGWRLGELLVHLGYVDQPVVQAFVQEQVREQLSELLLWTDGTWRLRVNQRTREDVAPPVEVADLLAEVERRRLVWAEIAAVVHGPDAVPLLSAAGSSDDETVVDGDAWSMLCKVDGTRTVAELARNCGLTMFEAGHVVHTLVLAGLLEIEAPEADLEPFEAPESFVPADVASRLAEAFGAEPAQVPAQPSAAGADRRGQLDDIPRAGVQRGLDRPDDDEVEHSISRVSEALSALLGQTASTDDLFAAPSSRRTTALEPVRKDTRRRDRDAAELATAQAELEAARAADAADRQQRDDALGADHVADVVDLQARRDEDTRQAEAARAAEDARLAEEAETARIAEEAEAARVAEEAETARIAEETEQARLAEEAEAARVAEEAETARVADEARLAEQARAVEEAAQLENARAVAAAEVSRLAAEAEQAEHERLAAERAERAREAARAEQEAAALFAAETAGLAVDDDEARVSAQLHADVFAELSAAANVAGPEPAAVAERSAVLVEDAPPPRSYEQATDTAALMRELSSLGLDDPPPPSPTRPVSQQPRPITQPKKRKGLFGR